MSISTRASLQEKVALLNSLPRTAKERVMVASQVELAIKNRLGKIALKKVN